MVAFCRISAFVELIDDHILGLAINEAENEETFLKEEALKISENED